MAIPGMTVGATGLYAYSQQISVVGNNIANINTNGFKKSDVRFQDVLYQTLQPPGKSLISQTNNGVGVQLGNGVQISSIRTIFEQGPLVPALDFDVAINGEGFFRVVDANGDVFYTRLGAFQPKGIGASGVVNIQTPNGPVRLDPPITLPGNNAPTTVSPFGVVQQGAFSAQIELTRFQNVDGLEQVGELLFRETAAVGASFTGTPGSAGFGTLADNTLEGSNVELTSELIALILASQAFNLSSQAFVTGNEELLQAIALVQQV